MTFYGEKMLNTRLSEWKKSQIRNKTKQENNLLWQFFRCVKVRFWLKMKFLHFLLKSDDNSNDIISEEQIDTWCDCTFHFSSISLVEFLKCLICSFSSVITFEREAAATRFGAHLHWRRRWQQQTALTQFSTHAFYHCEIDEAFHSTIIAQFFFVFGFCFLILFDLAVWCHTLNYLYNDNLWRWIYCLNGPFFEIIDVKKPIQES